MGKRHHSLSNRSASGYIESIFAIMVISVALTVIMASLSSIDRRDQGRKGLESESAKWTSRILDVLTDDGLTVESRDLDRLEDMVWEPGAARGMRAEIYVLGTEPTNLDLRSFGDPFEDVDVCYTSRTPISYVEGAPQVQAAILVVMVW